MPSKNTVKTFDIPAFYHVYNRGAGKQPIFLDATDKQKFLSLFARYLDPDEHTLRTDGLPYERYNVEVIAYCLMKNHFHLLLYQETDTDAITKLVRSVSTAYTMYFNHRHGHSGHLFQGIYKASHIQREAYLLHITRYIHLNPRTYQTYRWSSLPEYMATRQTAWLQPERVLDMTPTRYLAFLEDYEDRKATLEEIKNELA